MLLGKVVGDVAAVRRESHFLGRAPPHRLQHAQRAVRHGDEGDLGRPVCPRQARQNVVPVGRPGEGLRVLDRVVGVDDTRGRGLQRVDAQVKPGLLVVPGVGDVSTVRRGHRELGPAAPVVVVGEAAHRSGRGFPEGQVARFPVRDHHVAAVRRGCAQEVHVRPRPDQAADRARLPSVVRGWAQDPAISDRRQREHQHQRRGHGAQSAPVHPGRPRAGVLGRSPSRPPFVELARVGVDARSGVVQVTVYGRGLRPSPNA